MLAGVLAAGLFVFGPAPGLGGRQAAIVPAETDLVWILVHEALGLGIGPAGPVALADATLSATAASAGLLYLAFAIALWGGVLDRLARRRRIGTGPFWAACGVHGVRLVRLYALAIPVQAAIVLWLFPALLALAARIVDPGDGVLILRAALFGLLPVLAGGAAVLEFARVRLVVEDRYSALGAILAAGRFIRRRPGRVALLVLLDVAVAWLLVAGWVALAPDVTTLAGAIAAAGWIVLRTAARLASAGAAVSFFQAELAHADYAAAPLPMWPDSPTVEGLRNLRV